MHTKRQSGFIGTGLMTRDLIRSFIRKGHSFRIYPRARSKSKQAAFKAKAVKPAW
jgi:3-hydroxyisobutyrate dehydrogenase-like beta-hydroxyacid dehydrogenase